MPITNLKLNTYKNISTYSYDVKQRLKIYFIYKVNNKTYNGFMYYPERLCDIHTIKNLKKTILLNKHFFVFYDKNNPKMYWIN